MNIINDSKNVLIVDDSGTARMIIRQCFEIAGFHEKNYFEAKNGQDALAILKTQAIDMLVTDLNMPVMDGMSLLKSIKDINKVESIYTVVITSSNNEAKEKELISLGANKVLNKPVTPASIAQAFSLR